MREFVICYDISDPERLSRLHRFLKKEAVPIQYSVLLFVGDPRSLHRLMNMAASLIDDEEDDLRAYPLPERGFRARLGRTVLPQGIQWSGLPVSW